ncbi:PTS-dependent dihydroxyacetone kinase phosphotransferase subunit DhaM [Mycoplasmopsis cynos]|uniref:PTS system enzyme I n=2 Tax=Mycoplasmopsis cynos TaxID=171284 RepID=L0RXJ2_MYCC1|nr:PTS enzyme I [Mycoplasmopsis cynos]MCU9933166.1 dihydroxyacetone kinase [Mycoplasmopsis cynos]MCU9935453.1 dihydroxyacetone kinase [Mycoplasmopsis cynos]TQC54740.1 dihydroxyacetone kinase [Mycoplasmopsis cynos]UWV80336.1 dihydroxyacetone kinase [Mycoplasmopsis cynos]UWV86529.1 dihydroxyacetone kinase [Mycoplasmopsis cynos]
MNKKLFILISHFYDLANTTKVYLTKMLPINEENVKLVALGGINNGTEIGTEPMQILQAIEENPEINEIFIFSDLGSATLAAESISTMVEDKLVYVAKGAFVENTFSAYVLANVGASFDEVKKAAEEKVIK